MNDLARPRPRRDPDSAPYWEGADREKLLLQRCADCGTFRYYARQLCPKCWSENVEWVEASGKGNVYSWSRVRRAPMAPFRAETPYVVGLIDLVEGVRLFSRVLGAEDDEISGRPVEVEFEDIGSDKLPVFRLVEGGADVAA
jgi:uncharacterized OB-fold protein